MERRRGALFGACSVRDVHYTSKRRCQVGSQMVLTLTLGGTTQEGAISKGMPACSQVAASRGSFS